MYYVCRNGYIHKYKLGDFFIFKKKNKFGNISKVIKRNGEEEGLEQRKQSKLGMHNLRIFAI